MLIPWVLGQVVHHSTGESFARPRLRSRSYLSIYRLSRSSSVNTQQTPQNSLAPTSSAQSQLRQSLKVKWLSYYRDNRDWLTRLGVWVNDSGERRPSSSFILATLSILEPRLTQLMPIVVELNSNADRVVKALGLNFAPDDELKRAIANGLLPAEQGALPKMNGSVAEGAMTFLPAATSPKFITAQSTVPQQTKASAAIAHSRSYTSATHSSLFSSARVDDVVSQATIPHITMTDTSVQDSVDVYLDQSEEHDIITEDEPDTVIDEGRSPHKKAAQQDETCGGSGDIDPFQSIRNIDIRI